MREDLGRGEHRVAREQRRRVAAGRIDDVAERVVADVGRREPEAERERDAAEDDQLAAHVALRVLVDHELVAVHLAGVVEHRREVDVLARHRAAARVLDAGARREVLEVAVRAREVRQSTCSRAAGRRAAATARTRSRRASASPSCSSAAGSRLNTCDLALPRRDHRLVGRADVLARGRLHVDDARDPSRVRERRTPSTFVSTSIVSPTYTGAPKRMSMYSRLVRAFSDTSSTVWLNATSIDEPRRADEALEAVRARVARVLRERVRRHRELGEGGEQPLGDRLPALVAEDAARAGNPRGNCPSFCGSFG